MSRELGPSEIEVREGETGKTIIPLEPAANQVTLGVLLEVLFG